MDTFLILFDENFSKFEAQNAFSLTFLEKNMLPEASLRFYFLIEQTQMMEKLILLSTQDEKISELNPLARVRFGFMKHRNSQQVGLCTLVVPAICSKEYFEFFDKCKKRLNEQYSNYFFCFKDSNEFLYVESAAR